ncbi:MAG: 4-(cytidine 5'-diphospho)-2-C-methyl-D-erythritol kinase [Alphaproteobacteria bacterium]|nr:4-(cytidine 5'-diphospho)-2-C-methyl-D-erythritol kinase [Alphaproteobacteria bacterium]
MVERHARAKVNLCLVVTGRRDDGYHLLDSIVAFADVGDRVTVAAADTLSLTVTGPFAAGLGPPTENLVWRAALSLAAAHDRPPIAAITLDKHLPIASGIGGGSADAAAALLALSALWQVPVPPDLALRLGADVPVCLHGQACRMTGIGEVLHPFQFPPVPAVLVNPGVAVPTAAVFRARPAGFRPPLAGVSAAEIADVAALVRRGGNDLIAPATHLAPEIALTLAAVNATDAVLAVTMSGSGATCVGLYPTADAASAAATALARAQPGWWVMATTLS